MKSTYKNQLFYTYIELVEKEVRKKIITTASKT
jgi:hypothetical protein